MNKINTYVTILFVIGILTIAVVMGAPDPTAATLTRGPSSRGTDPSLENSTAEGGNVTSLNVDQTRITGVWQGFYGNVTGQVVLENGGGNNFYDWSLATIGGEVYASRNTVSDWSNVNCTNSTHWEAEENSLGIELDATDGVNETYDVTSHPQFEVGTLPLTGCRSTRPYNSSGSSSDFWNVLVNTDSSNVVYTALLSDDSDAFEGGTADFELLVPVNTTSNNQALYYFYAELD